MLVALIAKDKPGALQTRLDNREAHVAYLKANSCVTQAGPLLDDAGDMCGSLIVLDVEDMAAAEAFVAGDPYGQAGLFASVELIGW
ncbi:MAG: YciI family protein, partial [Pseudomonadota bacterium]